MPLDSDPLLAVGRLGDEFATRLGTGIFDRVAFVLFDIALTSDTGLVNMTNALYQAKFKALKKCIPASD